MIAVHVSTLEPVGRWQASLLERSFLDVRQPGELVRLVATRPGEQPISGVTGRVVGVPSWSPHPWTGDRFAGYQRPAAVLHWLAQERNRGVMITGPILLLDTQSILRAPAHPPGFATVAPGRAFATPWARLPGGRGPWGLSTEYDPLEPFCVRPGSSLPALTLPALIDSRDLEALTPRWLELTALLRLECELPSGRPPLAERIAFLVAAAEHEIALEPRDLAIGTEGEAASAPILGYERPVESPRGEIVWDPATHRAGDPVFPERARTGAGRELLRHILRLTASEQNLASERARLGWHPEPSDRPSAVGGNGTDRRVAAGTGRAATG